MGPNNRRVRLLLVVLVLSSFTLITLDLRDGGAFGGLRNTAASLFGPVQRVVAGAFRPVSREASSLASAGRDRSRAEALQHENDQLRQQVSDLCAVAAQEAEVGRLFHLAGLGGYTVKVANVIGFGSALGFQWTVTIDLGSSDGIRPAQTVIDGGGLVGRVKYVTATTATVLLLIDPEVKAGTRLEASDKTGTVTGNGNGPLRLALFDTNAPLVVGQRLITYGEGGSLFVPGVPVGTVSQVLGSVSGTEQEALVQPYVDFGALRMVGVVVRPPARNPVDSVLPAKPSPGSSPVPIATTTCPPAPGSGPFGGTTGGLAGSATPSPAGGQASTSPTTRPTTGAPPGPTLPQTSAPAGPAGSGQPTLSPSTSPAP